MMSPWLEPKAPAKIDGNLVACRKSLVKELEEAEE